MRLAPLPPRRRSLLPAAALADDAADIRARLEQWTEDFNAKRAEPVCDLFSKELLSTVRGQGDQTMRTAAKS